MVFSTGDRRSGVNLPLVNETALGQATMEIFPLNDTPSSEKGPAKLGRNIEADGYNHDRRDHGKENSED